METAVRDTSLLALKTFEELALDQRAVLELLEEIGPAHDRRLLEALNQKERASGKPRRLQRHWEINQVTARRNELVKLGLVMDIGAYSGLWNDERKVYHFWAVQGDYRQPAGWVKQPAKPHTAVIDGRCANCGYRRNFIQQKAEGPIVEKLKVSEAGSTLARHGHEIKKQPVGKTGALFRFA